MPSPDLFLGIDMGTTGVKATIIDEYFKVHGQQRVEYRTYQRHPLWAEQDPWEWWEAACSAIKQVLSGKDPKRIRGIGISSQAPTLLGLDLEGNPTGPAALWMDRRGENQCCRLTEEIGEEALLHDTGNRIDPYYMLPKLMWQKEWEPVKYEHTGKYVQANGWMIYQLTGKISIDETHAALTQLYSIHTKSWNHCLLQELGISVEKLPDIFACSDIVGLLKPEIAEYFGFKEGTPIVAGAIDGATAPLGLGPMKPGQAFEMSGQSSGIGVILDRPVCHRNLALLKHAVKDQWILKGSMSATGGSIQWFRDYVDEQAGRTDAYERYEEMARQVPAGSQGLIYLPYLAGERAPLWDSHAKGVFFGLHLHSTKAEMVRAIMEGTAYGLKNILQELNQAGFSVPQLLGTGGGYMSREWSQIKADILERDIHVFKADTETASLGAAYLAVTGLTGIDATDLPQAKHAESYKPNETHKPVYEDGYHVFKELYIRNKDLFKIATSAGDRT